MPSTACPFCARKIEFGLHELELEIECAQCAGRFTPAGGPVRSPPLRPATDSRADPNRTAATVRFSCPTCGATLSAPTKSANRQVNCPKCKQVLIVPVPPTPKPTPEPIAGIPLSPDENRSPAEDPEPPPIRESWAAHASAPNQAYSNPIPQWSEAEKVTSASEAFGFERPGKLQTIAVLLIVAGGCAILGALVLFATCWGLAWPGSHYALVTGILAIIKGAQLSGSNPRAAGRPTVMSILMIVNIDQRPLSYAPVARRCRPAQTRECKQCSSFIQMHVL
jgi:hypothetical protein